MKMLHPLRAEAAGTQVILNTSRDTQIIERRFIVSPTGNDCRLARVGLITSGLPGHRAPILPWRLFRLAPKVEEIEAAPDSWTPLQRGTTDKGPAEEEAGPYYEEDLERLSPLRTGECLTFQFIVHVQGLLPLFEDGQIGTELHIEIEDFAAMSFPLYLLNPVWNAQATHYLALDYGNQDFMLAYMNRSSPSLITPSILEQRGEGSQVLLIPESSKAVVIETYDPDNPVFTLGNAVEMVSDERLEDQTVWADPDFTGSRIESLKPHLFSSADSVLQSRPLFGQPPNFAMSKEGLGVFLKRYFQRIIGTIDWHISGGHLGTQFKIHSPIIVTHPVGVDRLFRQRIEACFRHDPPYLHYDRKVKFINEAMAALGTIWSERIQEKLEVLRQQFIQSEQQFPSFRDQVRLAMGLPIGDEGEGSERGDYVLILQADVGHGTTDLCISRVRCDRTPNSPGGEKLIFQQALPYSMHLGGRDLTKAVFHHCIDWLKGRTSPPAPVIPKPILDVLTDGKGVAQNQDAPHFWRFLEVVEKYKKRFADETISAINCPELLEVCKGVADAKGLAYEPSEEDLSFAIDAEDIQAAIRPIVQEIARTIGSLKKAFERDQRTRVDLFAFVGQSMQLKMLRDEIVAELGESQNQALVEKSCIFLDDGTELKGAVAKGALYLLGPMTPDLEPVDYDRLFYLPYSVYARDFTNRILEEGTAIDRPIEDDLYKTLPQSHRASDIFQSIPASFDIKIRYERIKIIDPLTGSPKFLERTIGRLYFPMGLQDQVVGDGDRVTFEFTSDEYLIGWLRQSGQDYPLTFEKITYAFQESQLFYNSRRAKG